MCRPTHIHALGADEHFVSTNLGHSDIQVTLNTYSHVTPTLQRRAAEGMDEVLGKELIESRELVAIP